MENVISHNMGKVCEKTNIWKLCVSQIFWVKQNPYNSKNIENGDYHATGKVWKNTNISNLWVS